MADPIHMLIEPSKKQVQQNFDLAAGGDIVNGNFNFESGTSIYSDKQNCAHTSCRVIVNHITSSGEECTNGYMVFFDDLPGSGYLEFSDIAQLGPRGCFYGRNVVQNNNYCVVGLVDRNNAHGNNGDLCAAVFDTTGNTMDFLYEVQTLSDRPMTIPFGYNKFALSKNDILYGTTHDMSVYAAGEEPGVREGGYMLTTLMAYNIDTRVKVAEIDIMNYNFNYASTEYSQVQGDEIGRSICCDGDVLIVAGPYMSSWEKLTSDPYTGGFNVLVYDIGTNGGEPILIHELTEAEIHMTDFSGENLDAFGIGCNEGQMDYKNGILAITAIHGNGGEVIQYENSVFIVKLKCLFDELGVQYRNGLFD